MAEAPLVSVLIPTKNSAAHLARCIGSVRAQRYPAIEVIVIDNDSHDATPEIARAKADRFLVAGGERSRQLNTGAKHANGKYLYRIDGDFVLDRDVIGEAVRLCETEGYDAVAVHNESDPSVSFWAKVRNFERAMYKYDPTIVGARFLSKEAFNAVGGFDEDLIAGEDYDIHNRLLRTGYRIGRIEPAEMHLGEPVSLAEFASKSFFYGQTIGAFVRKSGLRGVRQVSPIRAAFVRHWKEFVAHPGLGLGLGVMQCVKYLCGGAGFLVAQFRGARR
ncbi:MAG: glycosyltransferase [Candidatus Eremiobacteraeota bacterium]|nr:glycosyltransferase [Candidatus Eremiobacteraeota bacterium]